MMQQISKIFPLPLFLYAIAGLLLCVGIYFIIRILQKKRKIESRLVTLQKSELETQTKKAEAAHKNIRVISEIGREITSNLSLEKIVLTIYKHVNELMDASVIVAGVFDEDKNRFYFYGAKKKTKVFPFIYKEIDSQFSLSKLCYAKQESILIGDCVNEITKYFPNIDRLKHLKVSASMIYTPLTTKKNRIGVFSVQSSNRHKFTAYHLDILKSLAIYIGIAIENSEAYSKIEAQNEVLNTQKKEILLQSNELKKQHNELQLLNATKDKFFSIVAHDLRTPFGTLINMSSSINENFADYETSFIQDRLSDIENSSRDAHQLLENLLEWARSQTNQISITPEQYNLHKLISTCIAPLTSTADHKHIDINNLVDANTKIFVDKNTFSTVIRNLISNALKFTPIEGQILIEVRTNLRHLELRISDSGVGIKPENLTKIFNIANGMTTRGTSQEKGSGLGLILCKEFVEKNGGTISAESVENKGSTFIITMPVRNIIPSRTDSFSKEFILTKKNKKSSKKDVVKRQRTNKEQKIDIDKVVLDKISEFQTIAINLLITRRIRDIQKFANELLLFSSKNRFLSLVNYSKKLKQKTDEFDIEQINVLLQQFEKLTNDITNN